MLDDRISDRQLSKSHGSKDLTVSGRMVRGFAIVAQYGQIKQVEAHTFKVKSQSGNGQYVITSGKSWDCRCPDHTYPKSQQN